MNLRIKMIGVLISLSAVAASAEMGDGVISPYSSLLTEVAQQWPPVHAFELSNDNPVTIRCLGTPGSPDYVGAEQAMVIDAPVERVAAVLDDIDHYHDIFPELKATKVVAKENNKWLTFWEQSVPLFFIPNVKFEMLYWIDHTKPTRALYRYRLKEAGKLKFSDGLIGVETQGPGKTRYLEYDFFDAEWGLLKTFAPGRVWKGSIEGIYLSDAAIKIRSEQPTLSGDQVKALAKQWLDAHPVESVLKDRPPFYKWKSTPK